MPAFSPDDVDREALLALTRALVACDTRNPPGEEARAIGVCQEALEPLGATFQVVEPETGRASLVATVGRGDGSRPTLVVNGHLDVVPINEGDWTRAPFGGELDESTGRLYGRGTTDMKGGIAAAVEALAMLARAGLDPGCDLVFHLVADEERGGMLGTKVLLEQGLLAGATACVVPEPTDLAVCVAERGLLVAQLTTLGRPAHGSEPRAGVSAIETAAKVVLALHAGDFGDATHPLLGRPSANIGMIGGGSGHNTVAESCRVTVDRRVLPGRSLEDELGGLAAKVDAIGDPDLRYRLEVETFGEGSEMAPDHPFALLVGACVDTATGAVPATIGMPFTTDARFVRNDALIPAVVCGPGGIAQAHTNDEFVLVDALFAGAVAYAELYRRFAAGATSPGWSGLASPTR